MPSLSSIHATLLTLPLLLTLDCDRVDDAPTEPGPEPSALSFNRDATAFVDELATLDTEIAKANDRAHAQDSWLAFEKVANLHMTRARLSGDYADYEAAEDALDEAFARAPEGSGPLLTRASLNFTLHRMDAMAADLAVVENRPLIDDPTRSVVEGLYGAIAFQSGEYEQAKEHYDRALQLDRTSTNLARLAHWHWRQGEFYEAELLYLQSSDLYVGSALEPRAWTHLQLGIMDLERGRYESAFEHYAVGAEILGGWWLLEEHIAEIAVLLGRRSQALDLYAEIIDNTQKGEFMDARAAMLLEDADGDDAMTAEAQALLDRAEQVYAAQIARFPEASYGHALGHYLDFGPAPRALELAEQNHALRPGVLSKLELSQAYLLNEQPNQARAVVDEALATSWRSADLYWVGSLVYEAVGDTTRAQQLAGEATALHPTIADDF